MGTAPPLIDMSIVQRCQVFYYALFNYGTMTDVRVDVHKGS